MRHAANSKFVPALRLALREQTAILDNNNYRVELKRMIGWDGYCPGELHKRWMRVRGWGIPQI